MRSSFFNFQVANSAMFVARGGVDTVGHNMANATTRGFSRQFVEQRANRALATGTGWGMIGAGAHIYGIAQARNVFLDHKFWHNMSTLGQFSVKSVQTGLLETTLDEMAETGVKTQFNRFFNLINELSTYTESSTHRVNLLQHGDFITTHFNETYTRLRRQQLDVNEEIRLIVSTINSKATQIAALNQQISRQEMMGARANDLRDQRAVLIDDLSVLANVDIREVERNERFEAGHYPEPEQRIMSQLHFSIHLNGQLLVDGSRVNRLEVQQRRTPDGDPYLRNAEDAPGLYDIFWERTGTKFNMYSPNLRGELRGLIDIRDGNNQNHIHLRAADIAGTNYRGNPNFEFVQDAANPGTGRLTFTIPPNQRLDLAANGSMVIMHNGRPIELFYDDLVFESQSVSRPPVEVSVRVSYAHLPEAQRNDIANIMDNAEDFRTGVTSAYKGIPHYINRLNTLARTVVYAFNNGQRLATGDAIPHATGHRHGFNVNGVNDSDLLLFTFLDPNTGQAAHPGGAPDINIWHLNAANIIVNPALLNNVALLQGADTATGGVANNEVILSWLRIADDRSLFTEGMLEDFINSMISELGIDKRQADNFTLGYIETSTFIDNMRMSIAGVNMDEESAMLIRYQAQFRAAANLINAIDSIYDTLINRLGNF